MIPAEISSPAPSQAAACCAFRAATQNPPAPINPGQITRPRTQGFVLYETAKREVTALAIAPDGTIYVSAIGEKQRNVTPAPSADHCHAARHHHHYQLPANRRFQPTASLSVFVAFPPVLSSSIYRISPNGAPDELWSSREDVVYGLGSRADGRLLAGTGNNGALLAIDSKGVFAQLAKSGSAQITGISRSKDGKLFVCTANPGKVFSVGPGFEAEGTYESRSFDAQNFSQWGRLEWWSPRTRSHSRKKSSAAKANRAWNFLRAPATPKIPAKNGPAGPVPTRTPARTWKFPLRDLRNGKP